MSGSETDRPIEKAQESAQDAARVETAPRKQRRYRAYLFQIFLLVVILAFAGLALLASTRAYFSIDLVLTQEIQENGSLPFQYLMRAVSWPGFPPQAVIIPLLLVVVVYFLGFRWEAVVLAGSAVGVNLINTLIKIVVHRPRPSPDLVSVFSKLNSYSFPSGHVMFYTGFFGFLFFLCFTVLKPSWKRTLLLILFGGLVLLVGISRIYLGEHWSSDVLAAYLAGVLALVSAVQIYRWGKPRFFVTQPVASDPGPQEDIKNSS